MHQPRFVVMTQAKDVFLPFWNKSLILQLQAGTPNKNL